MALSLPARLPAQLLAEYPVLLQAAHPTVKDGSVSVILLAGGVGKRMGVSLPAHNVRPLLPAGNAAAYPRQSLPCRPASPSSTWSSWGSPLQSTAC